MDKLFELLKEQIDDKVMTEDMQKEIKAMFEVSVNEAVKTKLVEKEQELEEQNAIELSEFKENLTNMMDNYSHYVADEFIKENKIAIQSEITVDMAKDLIESILEVVKSYGIEVEPEKLDEVAELEEKINNSKSNNSKLFKENVDLKEQLFEYEKAIEVMKSVSDLTEVKKSQVIDLLEGLEFDSIEDFKSKLDICIKKTNDLKEYKPFTEDLEKTNLSEGKILSSLYS